MNILEHGQDIRPEPSDPMVILVKATNDMLHNQLGPQAKLHGILIGPENINSFQHLSTNTTFRLLRATIISHQADTTSVVLSNEGHRSIIITKSVRVVLLIRF